jgi:hypothetical protein
MTCWICGAPETNLVRMTSVIRWLEHETSNYIHVSEEAIHDMCGICWSTLYDFSLIASAAYKHIKEQGTE